MTVHKEFNANKLKIVSVCIYSIQMGFFMSKYYSLRCSE